MSKKTSIFLILIFGLFLFLLPDFVEAGCCGSVTLSISGAGTCTVQAHMCADNCANGTSWQIRDNGTIKCSGTVINPPTGFYEYDCSPWTVGVGTHIYRLYIGGSIKDSDSVTCPPAIPKISFSPSNFTFTATEGGANPPNQTLNIWNSGPIGTTLNWSVSDDAAWLVLSPTSGNSTGEQDSVTLSVNIAGMPVGIYTATITITDPNASNNPQTVPVRLNINLNPPSVTTNIANPVATTTATLNGTLNSLGYNPAICPTCSTIVWFEFKKSTDAIWTKACEQTKTSTGSFSCDLTGLTANTTYQFKAFAKNGGSL